MTESAPRRRATGRPLRGRLLAYDALFAVGLAAASPLLLLRLALRERYSHGLPERFGIRLPPRAGPRRRVWVHAASAGEMNAAVPLVRGIEERRPDLEVVVSSTTTSGVAASRRLLPGRTAFLLPLDLGPIVRRVLDRVDPVLLVLVELELWPNLVHGAANRGTDVVVANGRIGERSARRYRMVRGLVGIDRVALFAVQTDEIRARLLDLGAEPDRVVVTGNLKADVPAPEGPSREDLRAELGLREDEFVVVVGSSHPGEETLVARAVIESRMSSTRRFRLVVAPRHLERIAEAEADLKKAGVPTERLSAVRGGRDSVTSDLVVDTMGQLAILYRVADAAIVGGSLVPGIGGHNVFEPVRAGAPTLVGPYRSNVRADIDFLLREGGIVALDRAGDLPGALSRLVEDGAVLARSASGAIDRARGASGRTLDLIDERCLSPVLGPADP